MSTLKLLIAILYNLLLCLTIDNLLFFATKFHDVQGSNIKSYQKYVATVTGVLADLPIDIFLNVINHNKITHIDNLS